ncbi:hypothetical protein D3C87_82780 [compost metagenome]
MKIIGFYMVDSVVASPTVFRAIVVDKLLKFGFKQEDIIKPGIMDRSDIVLVNDHNNISNFASGLDGQPDVQLKVRMFQNLLLLMFADQ